MLHLHGEAVDFQSERSAACLESTAGTSFLIDSRRIGRAADYRNFATACLALLHHDYELIHAWDAQALSVAAISSHAPIVYSPSSFPARGIHRWLHAILPDRELNVVCASSAQQDAFVALGVPPRRCQLIRPGIDSSSFPGRPNREFRTSLGLTEEDVALLCPGESTRAADHELGVWVGSILHVLDPRYKVLLWGRGVQTEKVTRLAIRLGQPDLCRLAEPRLGRSVEFEELVSAADAALVSASGPVSILPVALCMAASVPMVATTNPALAELLEEGRTAITAPRDAARLLAQRLLELRENERIQRTIAARARVTALELFSVSRFVEQHHALYARLAANRPRHRQGRRGENARR